MTTRAVPLELSVVVPAYNEERNIVDVVADTGRFLRGLGVTYEINVVDDGSVDRTVAVLMAGNSDPALRLIRHRNNRGYGAALRSGFAASRGRYVLLLDGDGQFRIDSLAGIWPRRGEADLLLGYRSPRKDPPVRRLAGWLYSRLFVRAAFGGGYRDVNCGFKLMTRDLLDNLELTANGALISAELLAHARRRHAHWIEIPVAHFPRRYGKATGLLPRVVFAVVKELLNVRRHVFATEAGRRESLRTGYDAVESAPL